MAYGLVKFDNHNRLSQGWGFQVSSPGWERVRVRGMIMITDCDCLSL